MIFQIENWYKNDYYIRTMNCNLIIANDYGDVTQHIKDLPEKS